MLEVSGSHDTQDISTTFAQAVPVEESDDDDDELPPLISSLVEVASADGIVPIIFEETSPN